MVQQHPCWNIRVSKAADNREHEFKPWKSFKNCGKNVDLYKNGLTVLDIYSSMTGQSMMAVKIFFLNTSFKQMILDSPEFSSDKYK